jgi:DNA-directed RNA polymerase specialized sigma24 family protein
MFERIISFKRSERFSSSLLEQQLAEGALHELLLMKVAVDRAFGTLSERRPMTFILRHNGGCTFREIEETVVVSTGTAQDKQHHAVQKLGIY